MSKNEKIAVFVAVTLALIFFIFFGFGIGSPSPLDLNIGIDGESNIAGSGIDPNNYELPDGLIVEDLVNGGGEVAEVGSTVTVHYVGTLNDGTQFDSSLDRGQPFTFVLGQGLVIQGWDEGLVGMKVGGIRVLTIPPEYGYGNLQAGPIPPNSILIFEVELLDVQTQQ
jgi:FKBP-type peptidyl-prolyl cis-trans isomerase